MNFQDLKNLGKVHFIGLGGIGMSALAFILRQLNIEVQGSDMSENYLTEKLRQKGATYFVGHDAKNITSEVGLVVKTSIIKDDNPEIIAAKNANIKIITRADLLALIMQNYQGITIAGTHGKTSTTGIVSVMCEAAGLDPTIVNGGVIHYINSNSKVGNGKYLIAESDESDASFVKLPTFIGAITNLEPEHLDFAGYEGNFDKQREYFEQYVTQIPEDGLCILCLDDEEVAKIYQKFKGQKNNLFTYSINPNKNADLTAFNLNSDVNGISFDAKFASGLEIKNIQIPTYGNHNISNALVAVAIANFIGIEPELMKNSLAKFNGVKRRFTKVGKFQNIPIIDDYGHHPTEIEATLKAARDIVQNGKIICVFEPHKYSRIKDAFNGFCQCFNQADFVIVTQIFAASQDPIPGISQDSLIQGIKDQGHKNVIKLEDEKDLAKIIKPLINEGDLIFCTGAGKITYLASDLESQLNSIS